MHDCPFCPLMRLDRPEPVAVDSDGLPVLIAGIAACEDCALIATLFDTAPFLIAQLAVPIAGCFEALAYLLARCQLYLGDKQLSPLTEFETMHHEVDLGARGSMTMSIHLRYGDAGWQPVFAEYMEYRHA